MRAASQHRHCRRWSSRQVRLLALAALGLSGRRVRSTSIVHPSASANDRIAAIATSTDWRVPVPSVLRAHAMPGGLSGASHERLLRVSSLRNRDDPRWE